MIELKQTETFRTWWTGLRDERARGLIAARLSRLSNGLSGDVQSVGDGISELRIHHGPGYRIYFRQTIRSVVILLCGGDKDSQTRDIKTAKRLASEWSIP